MDDGISLLGRVLRAWRRRSFADFWRLLAYNVALVVTGQYWKESYAFDRSFDRKFNVETAGTEAVEYLTGDESAKKHATPYEPVTEERMQALLGMVEPLEPDTFIFIDLGSGKGRALFLAAEYPFRQIIGVEYASELHEVAVRNTTTYRNPRRKCLDIRTVCGDATTFVFPEHPTVCFMNNPFGAALVERVAQRIDASVRSSQRPFFIVYLHANHPRPIDQLSGWMRIGAGVMGRAPYVIWRWDGPRRAPAERPARAVQ